MSKKKDGKYKFHLVMEEALKPELKTISKMNRHTINDEIVIAVERHIKRQKSKLQ
jgi:hypothetical protein